MPRNQAGSLSDEFPPHIVSSHVHPCKTFALHCKCEVDRVCAQLKWPTCELSKTILYWNYQESSLRYAFVNYELWILGYVRCCECRICKYATLFVFFSDLFRLGDLLLRTSGIRREVRTSCVKNVSKSSTEKQLLSTLPACVQS